MPESEEGSSPPSSFFLREGGVGKGRERAGGCPSSLLGRGLVAGTRQQRQQESSEAGRPRPWGWNAAWAGWPGPSPSVNSSHADFLGWDTRPGILVGRCFFE